MQNTHVSATAPTALPCPAPSENGAPSGVGAGHSAANLPESKRKGQVLVHYQGAVSRLKLAGVCLPTLRTELAAIYPATLARLDHAASLAEHSADWFAREGSGWQAFLDSLQAWEAAALDADVLVNATKGPDHA